MANSRCRHVMRIGCARHRADQIRCPVCTLEMVMTLKEAQKILETTRGVHGALSSEEIWLDGHFTADQLEAIAIAMRARWQALENSAV